MRYYDKKAMRNIGGVSLKLSLTKHALGIPTAAAFEAEGGILRTLPTRKSSNLTHYGNICLFAILLSLAGTPTVFAEDKPTSLPNAQAAVEANLRTSEGKAFDEQMGTEFVQKHLGPLRQCKQSNGGDLRSFWILLKLDKDGSVKEILLYPTTKLGTCAREALLKDKFPSPPRPDYWISVYMKLAN